MKKVLFVCLGNICRSPLAEGLAKHLANEKGVSDQFYFDSCGTSRYHIGEQPDDRTLKNAANNGIKLDHQARQFEKKDFRDFEYILAMDAANLSNIKILDQAKQFGDKLYLMRDFDPNNPGADVPDPYFGGEQGFQNVYDILERSVNNFIETELI
ncbi:low molecular weight protein-tyrosine-phosphatase [Fulvivirga sp.]|uniref:low molecular weight protein-tyrosine-phosphatase n=1 Tax=Fulvivirga sp. TaxID=1931237 RepID=UPI0032EC1EDF